MATMNNLSPIGQQLGLLGDLTGAGQVAETDEDRKRLGPATATGPAGHFTSNGLGPRVLIWTPRKNLPA
jgi:hypothetical protein